MDRIKSLNCYQKIILIINIIMVLVFTIIYPIIISRVGFEYKDVILLPYKEGSCTVYSGKLQGEQAKFTVFNDKSVIFQYGDKIYGTYTAKEDSSAIPEDKEMSDHMTGVELKCDGEILFRGGVMKHYDMFFIYNEDGSDGNIGISVMVNGIETDENGNIIDHMEPAVADILDLMSDPDMVHKGDWTVWFLGVLCCIITVVSVIFADELFRLGLIFRINNIDQVEPSGWEIAGRYISWTVIPVLAMVIFIMGIS